MKKFSMIKLFPFVVAGLLVGCASAEDTITLHVGEVVTYAIEEEPAPVEQDKAKVLAPSLVKLAQELHFELNSVKLTATSKEVLKQVAEVLQTNPTAPVTLVGYTCPVGEKSYNQTLSEQRAKAVSKLLQQNYAITNPISIEGRGSSDPKEDNHTRAGRQANRRVEVYMLQ